MGEEQIIVRYMACRRCLITVRELLVEMGFKDFKVDLSKITFERKLADEEKEIVGNALIKIGLELVSDRDSMLVESTKAILIDCIYNTRPAKSISITEISKKLMVGTSTLTKIFIASEGRTIDRYALSLKIEKAKELILYKQLTLAEISDDLGFPYPQNFSNCFKRETGLSPSQFRKEQPSRKMIHEI